MIRPSHNLSSRVTRLVSRAGFGALVLAGLMAPAPALAADADAAIAVVNRMHAAAIDAANAAAARKKARIAAEVSRDLDMPTIGRKVLGKAWDGATEAERRDFIAVLRDLMAAQLVNRLHAEDRFAIESTKPIGDRDVMVFSVLTEAGGKVKQLAWKLHPCGGVYCVYDLVGDGASLTLARRDDYAGRLAALGGSVAALTQALRAELDGKP